MSDKRRGPNTRSIKEQSLKKYKSKDEVTKKWVVLNKKLNPNKTHMYYNGLIIEAVGVIEYVIENTLKEDFILNNFIGNVTKLMEKGFPISDNDIYKLKRIKWYRNIGAHNTGTSVQEIINYEVAKDTFLALGTLLNKLDMLETDNINPQGEKLCANVEEVIGETCLLQEVLGEGGSGKVFKAYHQRLDLTVAVKEIDHDIVDMINVANEKNMLLSLRHIGIPRIYDIIQDNQTYYLVMDYIQGQTLKNNVETMGSLPLSAIARVGTQLCDIMNYLHNFKGGIIFKDLKPSNIMIDKDNNIHLIDFGISERVENKDGKQGIYSGTRCYASPEQLRGEVCDIRSDIYSLGATLYFITEGESPVEGSEQRFKRTTPAKLINIIEKAMAENKENRYKSVEEFKRDLEEYQRNLTHTTETIDKNVIKPKANKNKLILTIAAASVIILSVFGVIMTSNSRGSKDTASSGNKTQQVVTASDADEKNNNKSKSADAEKTSTDENKVNDKKEVTEEVKETTAEAFNGKASLKIKSYEVDRNRLVVKAVVENNYDKEFNFSPYDIYMTGDNGSKFSSDIHAVLAKGIDYKFVPGEKKEVEFIFKDYKQSDQLTLKVSKIFCFGNFDEESFTVKLK
ncbi:serine/threonine-protein kinase [Clostridium ganghwense]|uniref:non-specific serine/threonine protein kinase n=1 Tax=Clostridium ganghwense TaxID=312089 RepID=A0ABT4CLK3_9CLOT|nr:serine/threonine-protein kinase [Clostridium ganghwense]MCY6369924.1 serine/threonine-protein kinase [Clostridium ganghwense]